MDFVRLAIERRERKKTILDLEEKVKGLQLKVEELLSRKLVPAVATPATGLATGLPLPQATPFAPSQLDP